MWIPLSLLLCALSAPPLAQGAAVSAQQAWGELTHGDSCRWLARATGGTLVVRGSSYPRGYGADRWICERYRRRLMPPPVLERWPRGGLLRITDRRCSKGGCASQILTLAEDGQVAVRTLGRWRGRRFQSTRLDPSMMSWLRRQLWLAEPSWWPEEVYTQVSLDEGEPEPACVLWGWGPFRSYPTAEHYDVTVELELDGRRALARLDSPPPDWSWWLHRVEEAFPRR